MNKTAVFNKPKTWLKLCALLLGIVILVWLPVEETTVTGVLVISGLICAWIGVWLMVKTDSSPKQVIIRHVLIGGGAGLLLAPLAILLMAIKTGIHGHGSPDFTIEQMESVFYQVPYYVLCGALIGAGAGLLRASRTREEQEVV